MRARGGGLVRARGGGQVPPLSNVHNRFQCSAHGSTDQVRQLDSLSMLRSLETSGLPARHAETLTRAILDAVDAQAKLQENALAIHGER